jgi:hypothetical protein
VQQGLRETPSGLRGRQGAAIRASWTALAGRLGMAVVFGLFLAAMGVHTAFTGGFWARGLYLDAVSIAALLMLTALMTFLPPGQFWLRAGLITLLMTPLMGAVVFGLDVALARPRPGLGEIPSYLLTSLVVSVMIAMLMAFSASRMQRQAPPAADASPAPPRFLERLPPRLKTADIWAVSAEDHYLRIHTSKGQELILLRLSDAMAELEGIEGIQTHRSWWVAKAAISDVKRGDGTATIILPDHTETPVSRTRLKAVRDLGWI